MMKEGGATSLLEDTRGAKLASEARRLVLLRLKHSPSPAEREALPDSLVLATPDRRILTRSAAVLALLDGMGGLWRLAGRLACVAPRPLADAAYDGIARIRKRLAPTPDGVCPIVPEPVQSRFDV
jgi:predicted DCC family thiol-disulfide oxidoreductase YuxK